MIKIDQYDAKTQMIRTFDVAVLGPGMIYAGAISSNLPPFLRFLLVTGGIATVVYNAAILVEVEKMIAGAKEIEQNNI